VAHLLAANPRLGESTQFPTFKAGEVGSAQAGALLWLILSAILPTQARASSRSKTDVVFMKNGDKITCEIRSLEQGQLTVKQEYANSTVAFDWNKVDTVQTKQPFVVIDIKGNAFSGHFSEVAEDHIV
jgi:hypothetical protein